jgi:hypothetical protein
LFLLDYPSIMRVILCNSLSSSTFRVFVFSSLFSYHPHTSQSSFDLFALRFSICESVCPPLILYIKMCRKNAIDEDRITAMYYQVSSFLSLTRMCLFVYVFFYACIPLGLFFPFEMPHFSLELKRQE